MFTHTDCTAFVSSYPQDHVDNTLNNKSSNSEYQADTLSGIFTHIHK